MGALKEGTIAKVESSQETGREITNIGEQKSSEALESAEKLSSLKCIDDDDIAATEKARNEARSTAVSIASNEIRQPTAEVVSKLGETSNEAQDYASVERDDAGKASSMVGDYSGIGSSLAASSFEVNAADFEGIASNANDVASQLESTNEQLAAITEGAF